MACTDKTLIFDDTPMPAIVHREVFELTFGLTTVTLNTPEYNDRVVINPDRIQRKTPNGVLKTFKAGTWGTTRTYRYSFSALTDQQVTDLVAFLDSTIGQPVDIVDHQGLTYTGIIKNPNGDITTQLETCGGTCTLEIEKL